MHVDTSDISFFSMEEENSRGTNQYNTDVILMFSLSCCDYGNRDHLHLNRAPGFTRHCHTFIQSWGWGGRIFIAPVLQMWKFGFRQVRIDPRPVQPQLGMCVGDSDGFFHSEHVCE